MVTCTDDVMPALVDDTTNHPFQRNIEDQRVQRYRLEMFHVTRGDHRVLTPAEIANNRNRIPEEVD
jgi:hypothetical protein